LTLPPTQALAAAILFLGTFPVRAQDIEPRSYANAPIGMNFAIAGLASTRGALEFPSATQLTNAKFTTNAAVLAYARALDLWGMSGKVDAIVPYMDLSGTALFKGDPIERNVAGLVDPRLRLSVNFHGAPALAPADFRGYRQDLIIGASLQVSAPLGQYDPARLVNIGNNRWSFKPELGASQALGQWILEGKLAATAYTDNDDFFGGKRRSQDPIYSVQGNAIYSFAGGVWASLDVTYYTGGRTTLDGVRGADLQQNTRVGASISFPVDRRNSVKLHASKGVSVRYGEDFSTVGVAWQYRWGAGL
jgi:hypothetical protein